MHTIPILIKDLFRDATHFKIIFVLNIRHYFKIFHRHAFRYIQRCQIGSAINDSQFFKTPHDIYML
jgi:hypothetical protein